MVWVGFGFILGLATYQLFIPLWQAWQVSRHFHQMRRDRDR